MSLKNHLHWWLKIFFWLVVLILLESEQSSAFKTTGIVIQLLLLVEMCFWVTWVLGLYFKSAKLCFIKTVETCWFKKNKKLRNMYWDVNETKWNFKEVDEPTFALIYFETSRESETAFVLQLLPVKLYQVNNAEALSTYSVSYMEFLRLKLHQVNNASCCWHSRSN